MDTPRTTKETIEYAKTHRKEILGALLMIHQYYEQHPEEAPPGGTTHPQGETITLGSPEQAADFVEMLKVLNPDITIVEVDGEFLVWP